MWNLYRTVNKVDPDGTKISEAKALFAEVRKARLSGQFNINETSMPMDMQSASEEQLDKQKRNQYGDLIEEDPYKS